MSHKPKNVSQSVLGRLKNLSEKREVLFDDLLSQYANERLLYRLSQTSYVDQLILKGGTLFLIWLKGDTHRATEDIDFLAIKQLDKVEIESIFKSLCTMAIEENDGIIFLPETVQVTELPSAIRVELLSKIDKSRQKLSIDIGYGDVITPEIQTITYPVLLPNMPAPKLKAYPKYTVIAEKFEAMVDLEMRNTRYKDFYDVWFICTHYSFDGGILKTAIERTFANRKTPIPTDIPIAFTSEFYEDTTRKLQWQNFIKKDKAHMNPEFESVIQGISNFLMPIVQQQSFSSIWNYQNLIWQ